MSHVICIPDLGPFISEKSECIQFLFDKGFLHTKMWCGQCNALLSTKVYQNKKFPLFACERGHNKITVSCTKGMWLKNSKILPAQILLLTFCFAHKFSYSQRAATCTIGDHLVSEHTIADWFNYCREGYFGRWPGKWLLEVSTLRIANIEKQKVAG